MPLIKRTALDSVFSQCVRERVDWTCERCGKYYPEGSRGGLDCSHLMGRRHVRTRHHPDNCFAHCRGCHQHLGSNPVEFTRWAEERLGIGLIEILREMAFQPLKLSKVDRKAREKEMLTHYRNELKKLRDRRADGVQGRLEFTGYD